MTLTPELRAAWSANQRLLGIPDDGIPGGRTAARVNEILAGRPLPPSPDRVPASPPSADAASVFPKDRDADLAAFYGAPPVSSTVPFEFAYPMRLYSAAGKILTAHRCHPKVKDSLEAIFRAIRAHYTEAEIRFLGLDIYHGCHNPRRRTGGSRWSLHAYAAAIDLDADRNRYGLPWSPGTCARPGKPASPGCGWMPETVVKIFESHGWTHGARWRTPDAMHAEATSR